MRVRLLRFIETSLSKERNDDDHDPHGGVYLSQFNGPPLLLALDSSGPGNSVPDGSRAATSDSTSSRRSNGSCAGRDGSREGPVQTATQVTVVSCYEADCDGFWSHRWLGAHAASNQVLSRDSQRDQ